jgi:hypothetical protein
MCVCASDVCASDVCASDVCASDVCASLCASVLYTVLVRSYPMSIHFVLSTFLVSKKKKKAYIKFVELTPE